MVTPYPPVRDGIAAYAVQSVASLRAQGHDVEVLSPGPSAAHHHLDLVGPRGGAALARRVGGYDKLVVQFHPDFFYPVPSSPASRVAVSLAYAVAFEMAAQVEVVVHEVDYRWGRRRRPEALAVRAMWSRVDSVLVHTQSERRDFVASFGVPEARVQIAAHGDTFVRRTRFDRDGARRSLGIDADRHVFLAIGFIQPHKGFDRAVRAFAGLEDHARLDVVGSVRVDEPAYLAHVDQLERLVEEVPGTHLHEGFVSDELFDRWIVAADVLVLPYREIWSSGVLERAALYGRPVIATDVGGLAEQAAGSGDVTLVEDDDGLRTAMWASAGRSTEVAAQPWPGTDGGVLRQRLQAEVVRRAALARGSVLVGPGGPDVRDLHPDVAEWAQVNDATAPLRRLGDVHVPEAARVRRARAVVKRVVRRLSAWQVEPVAHQVNQLRSATLESLERLAVSSMGESDGTAGKPSVSGRVVRTRRGSR